MFDIQNNGIAVFKNAYSHEFCDKLISHFEWSLSQNKTWERTEMTEMYKKDTSCKLDNQNEERLFGFEHTPLVSDFNKHFFENIYSVYVNYFSVLNNLNKHGIITYKIQKTLPGGGYHIWHCEVNDFDTARRIGTYILYLNDVPEGGETEFLYLSQRIKPEKGTLLLFPAGYAHTHRGNPPLTGAKYIMTGWIEFM